MISPIARAGTPSPQGRFWDRTAPHAWFVAHILITGMSGAGKSTLVAELNRRCYLAVDTDYGGWTRTVGLWDERRMDEMLTSSVDVVVSGTVENQVDFYDRFEHVVLLSAPVEVLVERVAARTNNPYGGSPEQQDEIRRYVAEVEPLLREGATVELDGRRPVGELADAISALM